MLNKGIVENVNMEFKMINMTANICKKNIQNIDFVAENLVKRNHSMLIVVHNYTNKIIKCHDMKFDLN